MNNMNEDYDAEQDQEALARECDEDDYNEKFKQTFGFYPDDLPEGTSIEDYDMSDENEGLYGEL